MSWTFNNRICKAISDFIRTSLEAPKFVEKNIFIPKKGKFQASQGGGNCKFTSGLGTFGAAVVIGKSTLPRGSNENLLTIRYFLGRGGRSNMLMLIIFVIFLLHRQNLHFSPHNMASTKNIYMRCASTTNIYIWGMRVTFLGDAVTNVFHGDLPGLSEVQIVEWGQMRLVVKTDLRWPGIKTWSWKLNLSSDAVSEKKAIWKWERRKAINNISKAANSWKETIGENRNRKVFIWSKFLNQNWRMERNKTKFIS